MVVEWSIGFLDALGREIWLAAEVFIKDLVVQLIEIAPSTRGIDRSLQWMP